MVLSNLSLALPCERAAIEAAGAGDALDTAEAFPEPEALPLPLPRPRPYPYPYPYPYPRPLP